ncbi:CHASE3 domain-containing protein [Hymenobacter sp. NST-14]|uniref:sensor histidine kinase n=1 Tax=Hymenobacter piscis TaxID=2839984 RepID=UPI001C01293F|nr:ATP-binding protein [Hymenobacter piscis]MBT9393351.1 CHASE3 domain-containing protein [Hymenobacter piscis]
MSIRLNTKIILGFIIAVGVLLLTSVTSWYSMQQLGFYTRQVEHTYQIIQSTSELRMHLRDIQGQARSYLLLNDSSYLPDFHTAIPKAHATLDTLQALTRDNIRQQRRLDTLRLATDDELAYLRSWRRNTPTRQAVQQLIVGDERMNSLRALLNRIKAEENQLLQSRRRQQDFYENTTPAAIVFSAVLAALLVFWLFGKITRELRANEQLQTTLAQTNEKVNQRIQIIDALADRVVQGDYSVKITDREQDSLGNLAASLNRMTQTLDTSFTALETRNRELDQFAYVASHDLKAPLRGVLTVVKWIEDELSHEISPQMGQYLTMMKGRLHRLEDLINGLLAYARAGRTERPLEPVPVQELVQEVAELVVPPTFEVLIPQPLPVLLADRLSLQQVFTNLMGNAAKYHHRPDGRITITARDSGDGFEFRIQDDGPGIAPQFHQKIFLMFQTLRDRHTAESTGIGLSIVKRIVEEQQGTIRVESAEGQGSAFIFTWPNAQAPG